jgi:hypothetical protein
MPVFRRRDLVAVTSIRPNADRMISQLRRGSMAQHRFGTAGEHRRELTAVARQSAVADGVHTHVDTMEPTCPHTLVHRLFGQPEEEELPQ